MTVEVLAASASEWKGVDGLARLPFRCCHLNWMMTVMLLDSYEAEDPNWLLEFAVTACLRY